VHFVRVFFVHQQLFLPFETAFAFFTVAFEEPLPGVKLEVMQ